MSARSRIHFALLAVNSETR